METPGAQLRGGPKNGKGKEGREGGKGSIKGARAEKRSVIITFLRER